MVNIGGKGLLFVHIGPKFTNVEIYLEKCFEILSKKIGTFATSYPEKVIITSLVYRIVVVGRATFCRVEDGRRHQGSLGGIARGSNRAIRCTQVNLCVCVVSRDEPLFAELKTGAGVKVRWAESLEAAAERYAARK